MAASTFPFENREAANIISQDDTDTEPHKLLTDLSLHHAKSPTQVLAQSLGFCDTDHGYWWSQTASYLGQFLRLANYDLHQQDKLLYFYHQYILPSLGPKPCSGIERPWMATMTLANIPFELSLNFQENDFIVRFSVEPNSALSGGPEDPLNQLPPRELASTLAQALPNVDMRLFEHFKSEFDLPCDASAELRANLPDGGHWKPQCFVAFDLPKSGVVNCKGYVYPWLKVGHTGSSPSAVSWDAIRKLHSDTYSIAPAVETLQTFLDSFQAETRPRVEVVGVDCVEPSQSRIKVYIRSKSTSFRTVRDMYTVGGRLADTTTTTGLEHLVNMWWTLFELTGAHPADEELSMLHDGLGGSLFSYELQAGRPLSEPKVYIPVWNYVQDDMKIAERLSRFFLDQGWTRFASEYTSNLESLCPCPGLSESVGRHSYVSFAYTKKTGLYVTAYYNPASYPAP
ncbi:hypothetical protein AJ80_03245 [Polytolypa hystricis UAMH7299]|uniref:Tryptophan dimethylallyltransferase n=1 Tax=Polytolypa hystricis (strain UAMH7299) TaxID=1447883 RepID=A0A2B7YBL1_POLH7|nr:hypothetical protein AJ80_03245 [Polytolypa hystricis UAMH7299]